MATRVRSSIPLKVLFIGNSFTARNDLPGLIGQLAAARGKNLEHRLISVGGASLRTHWNGGEAPKAIRFLHVFWNGAYSRRKHVKPSSSNQRPEDAPASNSAARVAWPEALRAALPRGSAAVEERDRADFFKTYELLVVAAIRVAASTGDDAP